MNVCVAARLHRGDIMSAATRSAVMARIKGFDTGPELAFEKLLRRLRRKYEAHPKDLPGRPDFVFRRTKVAIFIDGDFWHGWRFPAWRLKLSEKWDAKIAGNIRRDRRNHARLRRSGWKVIRIWEHELDRNPAHCLARVVEALQVRSRLGNLNLVACTLDDSSTGTLNSNGAQRR